MAQLNAWLLSGKPRNQQNMKELVFATSAPNKYHEVVKLLSEHAAILQMQLLEDLQLSVPSFEYPSSSYSFLYFVLTTVVL